MLNGAATAAETADSVSYLRNRFLVFFFLILIRRNVGRTAYDGGVEYTHMYIQSGSA